MHLHPRPFGNNKSPHTISSRCAPYAPDIINCNIHCCGVCTGPAFLSAVTNSLARELLHRRHRSLGRHHTQGGSVLEGGGRASHDYHMMIINDVSFIGGRGRASHDYHMIINDVSFIGGRGRASHDYHMIVAW